MTDEPLAKVYEFPVKTPSCENCASILYGRGGLYCRQWQEDIFDPRVAEYCDAFDPDD